MTALHRFFQVHMTYTCDFLSSEGKQEQWPDPGGSWFADKNVFQREDKTVPINMKMKLDSYIYLLELMEVLTALRFTIWTSFKLKYMKRFLNGLCGTVGFRTFFPRLPPAVLLEELMWVCCHLLQFDISAMYSVSSSGLNCVDSS